MPEEIGEQYIYQRPDEKEGKRVYVIDKYSGLWVFRDESGAFGHGLPNFFKTPGVSPIPSSHTPITSFSSTSPLPNSLRLQINRCKPTDLTRVLPGIGRGYATRILARKPEGGYRDWAELQDRNQDLNIEWDLVKSEAQNLIEF